MITDPKVGDVVYLDPDDPAGWPRILQYGERYQIVSMVPTETETETETETQFACRLRNLHSGEIMPKGESPHGTWACYLIRDEFLTAARNAVKKERKRASRAKTSAA